ncbi:MAG TPA: hypothetical protein VMZ27_15225 [Candidatus Saccharimonadales bacterium]|nr:hypothetical protein [Candidatus Saccharimonadales bacterium]
MDNKLTLTACILTLSAGPMAFAHEVAYSHVHGDTNPAPPLKMVVEKKGPIKAPAESKEAIKTSGQGFWKFAAEKDLVPTPEETKAFLKGAHGTIIVDSDRDIVYWGLERVGWVAFSNRMSQSWVVKGDGMVSSGNLHGADILQRKGQLPLVVAADNVEHEVYLSDTTFTHVEKLDWPEGGPYTKKGEFNPTDAAFVGSEDIWVTDGYGKRFFMPAKAKPFKYTGTFYGGEKAFSNTPHGITYNSETKSLLVSARPEAIIKEYSLSKKKWLESMGLPAGAHVCDVDLWEDYALVPCLDGPPTAPGTPATPGPIYIVNLKKKTLVSTIQPKTELGYADAQHMHDAAWYVRGKGKDREVFVLFTNWNPGGIGALKLVNVPDKAN